MKRTTFSVILLTILSFGLTGYAAEPSMSDYTAYPIFLSQSVKPNIMIILDNSGSMNFNAYGSYPGDGKTVKDGPFEGEPYSDRLTIPIAMSADDMEEYVTTGEAPHNNSSDLDLGGYNNSSNDAIVGLRFQGINIPQGAAISSATITFTAKNYNSSATSVTIKGELSPNADEFSTTINDDISLRDETTASVAWNAIPTWEQDKTYTTPDLSDIIEEIVKQSGWQKGNALVFKISGTGKRDAHAYNSSSSMAPRLNIVFDNPEPKKYYGYFNPDYFYTYGSNKFDHKYKKINYVGDPSSSTSEWKVETLAGVADTLTDTEIVTEKLWDGNWLNWLCMRRIDVLRKVLMGGLATSRTGGGNQVNYGETPDQTNRTFIKWFDTTNGSAVSPYDGNYSYGMGKGYIYADTDSDPFDTDSADQYDIKVQKDVAYEPDDFFGYDTGDNLAGILQKVGDKARWGNMWFNRGTGSNNSGGKVAATIGTNMVSLVTDLQNQGCDTYTPLAETYYVATQYFKQEDPATGLDYANNVVPHANDGDDPWKVGSTAVPCAKSFVILLTDGASTKDGMIPDALKDTDGDGDNKSCDEENNTNCDYGTGGTDYLDDVALYARTTDLRSDLEDDQNVILYTVYAFGDEEDARSLLKDAARNGGFDDRDGDKKPDGTYADPPEDRLEWDKNSDGLPDTFFEASDGYELEKQLMAAITDILRRAASGTAASVLSNTSEGEGMLMQAYFRSTVTEGFDEAKWLGYLQSLWVDPWGNLREDSNQNLELDLYNSTSSSVATSDVDKIVTFIQKNNDTMVTRYTKHFRYNPDNMDAGDCILSDCSDATETLTLEDISPIFEAGKLLARRSPGERKIFTFIDKDNDETIDETTYDGFDDTGEVVRFAWDTSAQIKPYLGVTDDTAYAWLGTTADDRALNLVDYIRGTDDPDLRNRTLAGVTHKLGDIINSTPVSAAKPSENFHLLYEDESYNKFFTEFKNREAVIYAGANDGMLHAFTGWQYDKAVNKFKDPYPADGPGDSTYVANEKMGDELWAYIPQTLLPHLKWLANPDYTHVYYVDLMPRIFDAQILPDNTHYTDSDSDANWGTFLIGALNMGGKHIWSEADYDGDGTNETRNFYPTFFMLDITEPRNPKLMWEKTYDNLAMSSSWPSIIRVKGDDSNNRSVMKWYAVFGSGYTDYEGGSNQNAYIYVVDLKTGEPIGTGGNDWLFGPLEGKAFINGPSSFDVNLNNNVDAVYFGESYYSSNRWKGKVYKIAIPCTECTWDNYDPPKYKVDPTTWQLKELFDSDRPITAHIGGASDMQHDPGNMILYFGTGRYIGTDDKIDYSQQYLYAVKDPFFNKDQASDYLKYTGTTTLSDTDLFDSDGIEVTSEKKVLKNGSKYGSTGTWEEFLKDVRAKDGWRISLETNGTAPSERVYSTASILGGAVYTPTFTPNSDICGFGGESNLYGTYFETGSGHYAGQMLPIPSPTKKTIDNVEQEVMEIKLPNKLTGAAPPRLGIHIGKEKGATAFSQQSTGEVEEIPINPPLSFKSKLMNWHERLTAE